MHRQSLIRQLFPGWRWVGAALAAGVALALAAMAYAQPLDGTKWNLSPQQADTIAFDANGQVWAKSSQAAIISLNPATNTLTAWTHPNAAIFGTSFGVIGVQPSGGDADRFVWGAGQSIDHINRLDTATGEVLSWTIPGNTCRGFVAFDASGNAWFGTSTGRIVRLDPSTNTLTSWQRFLPFATCTDIIGVDSAGDVWYCGRNLSNIGKLDPDTGEITEWDITGTISDCHSRDASGRIWIARSTKEVLRLDPATNELTTWPCPVGCGNVGDVSQESGGKVWFGEFNRITSLDTATNHFEQYNTYGADCGVNPRPFIAPDGQVWTTHAFTPICRFPAP